MRLQDFLRLAILLFAFFMISQSALARLGDDREALEKRFGKGEPVKQSEQVDLGLWDLFGEVLFFEKNGIGIVAGLSEGQCLAISYQFPKVSEDKSGDRFSWSEAQVLIEKNTGGSPVVSESGLDGNSYRQYESDVFAKLEAVGPYTAEFYTRVAFYSGNLFEDLEDFKGGVIRSEFLKQNSLRDLSDF